MRLFRFIVLFPILIAASCSPKVTTSITSQYEALTPEQDVAVIDVGGVAPDYAVYLGTISIGDTGFTTRKGSFTEIVDIAKSKARESGGNLLVLTEHRTPDLLSSIHRIKAEVYRVADISEISLDNYSSEYNPNHPDFAIIYFYRESGAGSLITYIVNIGKEKVFKAKNNSAAEVKIKEAGQFEVWAKTEKRSSLMLKVEMGMEYYINCSVGLGAFVGVPELSIVHPSIGKVKYERIINK